MKTKHQSAAAVCEWVIAVYSMSCRANCSSSLTFIFSHWYTIFDRLYGLVSDISSENILKINLCRSLLMQWARERDSRYVVHIWAANINKVLEIMECCMINLTFLNTGYWDLDIKKKGGVIYLVECQDYKKMIFQSSTDRLIRTICS